MAALYGDSVGDEEGRFTGRLIKRVNILRIRDLSISLSEKDVTNMKREKTRLKPVILDCNWRYRSKLMVLKYVDTYRNKHRCKLLCVCIFLSNDRM